ncbi:MAG: hypothetical protein C5B51_09560 [Terriglobia bacterium]|nr:MAG: hypothetical protein C5B51_09560 [Terriglobia bacterium]
MTLLLSTLVLIGLGLAAIVAMALRRVASQKTSLPLTADWIDQLSAERYRPMLRLLDGADFEFVASQPGGTPQLLAKMRRERCVIFRSYLRQLQREFGGVCTAIKILMLHAEVDRPDLASTLLQAQVAFAFGFAVVRVRLVFFAWGIGTPDVAGLLQLFDGVRMELRSLVPAVMPAGA